jgi:hypothetical protein
MMARIKGLVFFGFLAVLAHGLHAQGGGNSVNCAPGTDNFDFPTGATGLPAATTTRTSTISITATGTVTLRIRASGVPATATLTLSQGGNPVAGSPTSLSAWGTGGAQVPSGTYSLAVMIPNPGAGVLDPYHIVAGIDDGSNCVEDLYYGIIGAGSGTQNFGTAPASPVTTCGGGGGGGGGGTNSGPIAGPGSGNSPPNNKDRFKVLLNTGGRRLVIGQVQGNNFTSFGGIGTYNARNSLRDGNMLRLSYIPMIPKGSASSSCCVSGLTRGSSGGSGRPVVIRTRVTRGSGRVSRRR